MGKKYFVWSFDDGLEQDKRIIDILRSFHMGATFNLNSGLYSKKQMLGRIGAFGIKEVPVEEFRKQHYHLLKYVPHYRIPEDEVRQVYEGFEIASHSLSHKNLTKLTEEEIQQEIALDMQQLSETFSQPVTGFAYPFGAHNEAVDKIVRQSGATYARTVSVNSNYVFPDDPMNLPISCWHISPTAMTKLDSFLNAPEQEDDQLFLMFAHGYEFDFNLKESSWEKFKRICDLVTSHDEIICCSTVDALSAHNR